MLLIGPKPWQPPTPREMFPDIFPGLDGFGNLAAFKLYGPFYMQRQFRYPKHPILPVLSNLFSITKSSS